MKKGFTLIEILIVVGVMAILAAIVIIAINPARQFAQARNTQRRSDVVAILDAVHQRMVDNAGTFAEGTTCDALPSSVQTIASATGVDLCACLVPTYLAAMPHDPSASGADYTSCLDYNSGYTIYQDASTGRLTVAASTTELDQVISVTR